jgi:hypothetical protein
LIVVLIFLIAVVIAADRVGALVGAHVLAGKVQSDENLPSRPSATIGGIPFLTQAISGSYKDVTITAREVPLNGLSVTTLTAHLHGVHLPFDKAITGSVSQVPVDRVEGTAFVSYADADVYLADHHEPGQHVTLEPGGAGTVRVNDKVHTGGRAFTLHANGRLAVADNTITMNIGHLSGASASIVSAAQHTLTVSFPLHGLPFRAQLQSVSANSEGMSADVTATNIVLGEHG